MVSSAAREPDHGCWVRQHPPDAAIPRAEARREASRPHSQPAVASPTSGDRPPGYEGGPSVPPRQPTWHPCQSPTSQHHSSRRGCGVRRARVGRDWKSHSGSTQPLPTARWCGPSNAPPGPPRAGSAPPALPCGQRRFRAQRTGHRPIDAAPAWQWPGRAGRPSDQRSDQAGSESDQDSSSAKPRLDGPPASSGRPPADQTADGVGQDPSERHHQNSGPPG